MQRFLTWMTLFLLFGLALPARAATGSVVKVLPQYLDLKGRPSISPSLYDRDAYQVTLREHPERRSGVRFCVRWKAKGAPTAPLLLKLELRGIAEGNLPKQLVLEEPVQRGGWFGRRWTTLSLTGQKYQAFGTVTAWRASLWEGSRLLGEQTSFLW
jgi:hypothetical protein